jgi:hypothetical protein
VLFIRGNDRDNSVNILRNLIRKYLSNPPDSRFQNIRPFVGARDRYAAFSKINYNAVSWSKSLVCSFLQILVLCGRRKAARLLNFMAILIIKQM